MSASRIRTVEMMIRKAEAELASYQAELYQLVKAPVILALERREIRAVIWALKEAINYGYNEAEETDIHQLVDNLAYELDKPVSEDAKPSESIDLEAAINVIEEVAGTYCGTIAGNQARETITELRKLAAKREG